MPSEYYFEKAEEKDDKELRELIKMMPMEGSMRIIFQKEPNFFKAEKIGAVSLDVLLCKEKVTNRIVGFGSRSIRKVFVNGKAELIGYLSSLRAIPEVRGGTLVARAYKALRELHADGQVPFYFTTIFDDNETAKNILTSGRAGLPTYRDIGMLNTYIVGLNQKKNGISGGDISRGSNDELGEIVKFLNGYNAKFQFSPSIDISDFEKGLFPNFIPENFYIAKVNGSINGAAGVWDQNSFKQTVAGGYGGAQIKSVYVSFVAIDPPRSEILRDLLDRIYQDLFPLGYSCFMIGLNELNPLVAAMQNFDHRVIKSRMYRVFWKENCDFKLDEKLPHLEIATL